MAGGTHAQTEQEEVALERAKEDLERYKWRAIAVVASAELLALSLWFSATAVTPALMQHWQIDAGTAAWLTMSVQLGFVVGALLSALTNLPDLFEPRKVFATGSVVGAISTYTIVLGNVGVAPAIGLRFITGMSLAAVYPVGMKIMATWTLKDRGLGIGILVGALTVGSAFPHLLGALGGTDDWRLVLTTSSVLAVIAATMILAGGSTGPHGAPARQFHWRHLTHAISDRPLRLANAGYLGHMWELYAMWSWIAVYALNSFNLWGGSDGNSATLAALTAFSAIAAGGIGSVVAGKLADRIGRTTVTSISMITSGTCAAVVGLTFGRHPGLLIGIALVWGFTIVSDSAQFSSAVSELADPQYMGTQLTAQTAMGFLLTIASIRLVPWVADAVGWRWAFTVLVPGPILGTVAMLRLRKMPESIRLAHGNR